ncbi:hypothetical protein ACGFW5_33325 [Streptomyces sp. NPDC048416]|uniref:hypothetical protein n=1 Tax=Streptomyces sp. NPDC048416 TaxID=3365546 RepID=UPI00371C02FD
MSEQYPYHHQQQPQYDQYGQPVPQPSQPQPSEPQPSEPQPPFPYEPYQDQQQYTQTWEGQTWDTQYQPTIPPPQQPAEPAPAPAPYQARHASQQAQPWHEGAAGSVEETAYLPPQNGSPYGGLDEGVQGGGPYGGAQDGSLGGPQYGPQYGAQDGAQYGGQYGGQVSAENGPRYGVDSGGTQSGGAQGGGGHGAGTTSVPLPPEMPMTGSGPASTPSYEPATPTPMPTSASGPASSSSPDAAPAGAFVPPAAAATGGPAYSPPTTVGNARITDAQRARAEGRSPVIAPGMQPAALTAALGLLLAVAAPLGTYSLVVPLIVLQAVTAAGWFRLNGMWPARQGIALAFAGALVADVALLALGREHAPAAILGTLGVWVLLTLVIQLRSHADPDERMYGLMATVAAAALAILAGGYLAAPPHAVCVGAAAVAVAVLARALPLPSVASVAVALLAAAGAGIAVGQLTGIGASGALLGLAAGACALIGLRVASYDYPSRFVHMTAGVALPLTAAVPVLYLIGRAVA